MKMYYEAPRLVEINNMMFGIACSTGTGVDCVIGCADGDQPGVDYPGYGRIVLGCGTGTGPA